MSLFPAPILVSFSIAQGGDFHPRHLMRRCCGVAKNQCVHSRSADCLRVFGQARADFPRRRAAVHRMMIALVGTRLTEAERPCLGRRSLGQRETWMETGASRPVYCFPSSPFFLLLLLLSLFVLASLSLIDHAWAGGGRPLLLLDATERSSSTSSFLLPLLAFSSVVVVSTLNTRHHRGRHLLSLLFPPSSAFYSNCFSSSSSSSTIPPPVKLYHV